MQVPGATCASKPAVVWSLVGAWGEGQTVRKVTLSGAGLVVGRWDDADLRLDFRGVSKRHSALRLHGERLYISDLNSTNGTFVNGCRITEETLLKAGDVVQFANAPFQISSDRAIEPDRTQSELIIDHAMTLLQFDRLMSERSVTPHFQPIVDLHNGRTVAFEALARSQIIGLESAEHLFGAAMLVQQEVELSRLLREEAVHLGVGIPNNPELFLNTHPDEMSDERLIASLRSLRDVHPHVPITLEIHEFAVTDTTRMRKLQTELRSLAIHLSYDDFGAGQARLVELVEVPPDYLKFDRGLVQDIGKAPEQRQQLLGTLVGLARDLGITTLAEGIESAEDGEVCRQLGFQLAQGYYYGRPAEVRHWMKVSNSERPTDSPPST